MGRFSHLLFVADEDRGDRSALRRALRLAAHAHARLTVVDVVAPIPRYRRHVQLDGEDVDLQAAVVSERTQQLRGFVAAATARASHEDVGVQVMAGHGVTALLDLAERDRVDLVIVPAPAGGLDALALRLVRECPVPVLVLRPTRARKLRVLAAIDPDPDDPEHDRLSTSIVDVAADLARLEDGDLYIAHTWEFAEEHVLRGSAFVGLPDREVDRLVDVAAAHHAGLLSRFVCGADLAGVRWDDRVRRGRPGPTIAALAAELDVNLIVIGTVGRTGLQAAVMGNTAESVLREADASVLAVHPDGG